MLSIAEMASVLVPERIAHFVGDVIETIGDSVSGTGLLTVTDMLAVLRELSDVSVASTWTVCRPFTSEVESRSIVYEDEEVPLPTIPLPTATLSMKNITLEIPTLSVAVARNCTVPERVLFAAGATRDAAGSVVSILPVHVLPVHVGGRSAKLSVFRYPTV